MPETPTAPETPTPGWFTGTDTATPPEAPLPSWRAPDAYPTEPAPVATKPTIKSTTPDGLKIEHELDGNRVAASSLDMLGLQGFGEFSPGYVKGETTVRVEFDPGVQTEEAAEALRAKIPPVVRARLKAETVPAPFTWGQVFDAGMREALRQGGNWLVSAKGGSLDVTRWRHSTDDETIGDKAPKGGIAVFSANGLEAMV